MNNMDEIINKKRTAPHSLLKESVSMGKAIAVLHQHIQTKSPSSNAAE